MKSQGIPAVNALWLSFFAGLFQIRKKEFFPFLGIFFGSLFLRGGLFAHFSEPLYIFIPIISIISQCILLYKPKKIIPYLIGYSIVLRILYMGLPNATPEEAYYWNYSKHLSSAYLDHPPMVSWMIGLGTKIFGNNEYGIRIFGILFWFLMARFSFLFVKNFQKEKSLIPVLILATFPLFFGFSFFITPDIALFAFWAGAIYFFERIFFSKNAISWVGVAIFLGLGMLTKYTISLLGISALVFIVLDKESRKWLTHPLSYLSLILILLFFSPVIYWNYTHNWASFAFQTTRRLAAPIHFSLHNLLFFILIQITPLGLLAFFQKSNLDDRRKLFIGVFTLVPLSVFVIFSFFHEVRASWTAPIFLVAMPLFVKEFERRKIYTAISFFFLLGYGLALHYLTLGIPGMPYLSKNPKPVAWKEMVEEIKKIRSDQIVVGMDKYMIASELAFYLNDIGKVNSSNLFGREGLMYGYWFKPEDQKGKDMILVGFNEGDVSDSSIGRYFKRLDPIQRIELLKNRKLAGRFFYRKVFNYIP